MSTTFRQVSNPMPVYLDDATITAIAEAVGGGTSGDPSFVKAAPYTPLGDQQLSNATLAASTALTVPGGATVAIVQNNHSQAMRWRDNGQAPTASVGQRIAAGEQLTYDGSLSAFRIIKEADGTGTVDVWYGS